MAKKKDKKPIKKDVTKEAVAKKKVVEKKPAIVKKKVVEKKPAIVKKPTSKKKAQEELEE